MQHQQLYRLKWGKIIKKYSSIHVRALRSATVSSWNLRNSVSDWSESLATRFCKTKRNSPVPVVKKKFEKQNNIYNLQKTSGH